MLPIRLLTPCLLDIHVTCNFMDAFDFLCALVFLLQFLYLLIFSYEVLGYTCSVMVIIHVTTCNKVHYTVTVYHRRHTYECISCVSKNVLCSQSSLHAQLRMHAYDALYLQDTLCVGVLLLLCQVQPVQPTDTDSYIEFSDNIREL